MSSSKSKSHIKPNKKQQNKMLITEIKNQVQLFSGSKSELQICTEVALKYNKNIEGIRSLWRRNKSEKEKSHKTQLLTDQDELTLVRVLEGFSFTHTHFKK